MTESVKKIGWLLTWTNILFKHNFMCMAFCLFCTFHYKKYYVYSFGEEKASKWFTKWANFASRQSEVAMKRSISEFVAWLSPSLTGGWVVWTLATPLALNVSSVLHASLVEVFHRLKRAAKPEGRLFNLFKICDCHGKAKKVFGNNWKVNDMSLRKLSESFVAYVGKVTESTLQPLALPSSVSNHVQPANAMNSWRNMQLELPGEPSAPIFQSYDGPVGVGGGGFVPSWGMGALTGVPMLALGMMRR